MDKSRKHLHEEEKRTRKMRRLAESLGVSLEIASEGLRKAKEETYKALDKHPALRAQIERN